MIKFFENKKEEDYTFMKNQKILSRKRKKYRLLFTKEIYKFSKQ